MIKISVIVPFKNSEKYLDKCISSILNQSFSEIELILINDWSNDSSSDICIKYMSNDDRIILLDNINHGVSNARNLAIDCSVGEWVVFVDSDDFIEKDFLKDFFKSGIPNKNSLVITGLKRLYFENSNLIWEKKFPNKKIFIEDDLFLNFVQTHQILEYGTICGKLYNLKIIKEKSLKFNSTLSLHEDHIFFLEYLKYVNEIKLIDNSGYCYVKDNQNFSLSTKKIHHHENLFKAYELLTLKLKELNGIWNKNSAVEEYTFQSFLIRIYLSGIKIMYKNNIDKNLRINKLNFCKTSFFKNCYSPDSFQGKFFKFILIFIPLFLIDKIFLKTFK